MLYAKRVVSPSVMRYIAIASVIFFLDQFSKIYIVNNIREIVKINPFVQIELVFNRGISWGIGHNAGPMIYGILITAICVFITGLLINMFIRYQNHESLYAELFIAVGAISNLVDRAIWGAVVDFIALQWYSFSWPVFNIADASIVLGTCLLGIRLLRAD